MIVILKAQPRTFVIWKLVNVFAKMALGEQDVINVHLGFTKINIYLGSIITDKVAAAMAISPLLK